MGVYSPYSYFVCDFNFCILFYFCFDSFSSYQPRFQSGNMAVVFCIGIVIWYCIETLNDFYPRLIFITFLLHLLSNRRIQNGFVGVYTLYTAIARRPNTKNSQEKSKKKKDERKNVKVVK